MRRAFEKMPRSRIALETGTHSPWVSRLLTELGHEVIVAHARNVRLIGDSSRKDDRIDARTLARLARIDPQLLSRSAKAQIHLMVGDQRLQQELEPNASWWLVGNLRGFLNLFQGSVFWARKLLT